MYWCACDQCRQDTRGLVAYYTLRQADWPVGARHVRSSPIATRVYNETDTFIGMQYMSGRRFDATVHPDPNVMYEMVGAMTLFTIAIVNHILHLSRLRNL